MAKFIRNINPEQLEEQLTVVRFSSVNSGTVRKFKDKKAETPFKVKGWKKA